MSAAGGCLCGAVRYRVRGPMREILVCHCVDCRRWAGRAWAATAAPTDELDVEGEDALAWVESPRSAQSASRGFCSRCGASLFYRAPASERTSVAVGSLDDSSRLRVAAHIWVEQAADWERPPDGIPVFPRGYPADAPALAWA